MKHYALGIGGKTGLRKFWLVLFTLLLAGLIVCAVIIRNVYHENLRPLSDSQTSLVVTIEAGSTVQEIAQELEDQKVIRAAWALEWYVRNSNARDKLQAGTYALRPSLSVKEIIELMTEGKIKTDLVTILPGQRLEDVRDSLINQGFSVEAVDAGLNPVLYENHPALADKPAEASLEGYLYPESFHKTAETDVQTIIKLALDELAKQLTPDVRAGLVAQGMTVHQGIILASVVGQEVSNAEEQKQVAQVFLKRLREGIELGADATTRYAIKKPKGPLTFQDLASDSPYNTRKAKGLPPGPISNFKASALQAVAQPASGNNVFFVTGRDGVTRFSQTIQEHERLISEYGASGEE